MIILRMCGFSRDHLKEIPKGSKKYHDLYFKEEIFPELKRQGYSGELIRLVTRLSTFEPTDRISTHEAFKYLFIKNEYVDLIFFYL
jgi:hypothetical protein